MSSLLELFSKKPQGDQSSDRVYCQKQMGIPPEQPLFKDEIKPSSTKTEAIPKEPVSKVGSPAPKSEGSTASKTRSDKTAVRLEPEKITLSPEDRKQF